MRNDAAYRELIDRIVASKLQILGRAAITKIADIPGIKITEGQRVVVEGDPFTVLQRICERYRAVTGTISDLTTKRLIQDSKLLERYPRLELPAELSSTRGPS